MAVTNAILVINQGATFFQTIACSLADLPTPIPTISAWPGVVATFTLANTLKGDANFKAVGTGTVSLSGNNATLIIDELVTGAMTVLKGRWTLEVSNGTDTHRIGEGGWRLARDTA